MRRDSRAVVHHADDDLLAFLLGADLDAVAGRGELERVLEQVDKDVLQLRRIDLDGGGVVRQRYVDPLEPPQLQPDRPLELFTLCGREDVYGALEDFACRHDCGQRRPKVVADRTEDCRLGRVASAQRLRLDRLAATARLTLSCVPCELLAVDRGGEQRRKHRENARGDFPVRLRVLVEEEPPYATVTGDEFVGRLLAPGLPPRAELDARRRGTEQGDDARRDFW